MAGAFPRYLVPRKSNVALWRRRGVYSESRYNWKRCCLDGLDTGCFENQWQNVSVGLVSVDCVLNGQPKVVDHLFVGGKNGVDCRNCFDGLVRMHGIRVILKLHLPRKLNRWQ